MKMTQAIASPAARSDWPAECTISSAAELHARLLMLLSKDPAEQGDVALELGQVSDFDSSAVQLLLALRRSLAERGRQLSIVSASASVRDALMRFGLSGLHAELQPTV